jgi:hypothetical protein
MTITEIENALNSIKNRICRGDQHQRYTINETLIEFNLDSYGEIEYKIQLINGKLCQVYKSKMNNENEKQ